MRILFLPIFLFYSLIPLSCTSKLEMSTKINGVNFVSPPTPITVEEVSSIQSISADWIAIVPYAFTNPRQGQVSFGDNTGHWWGEKPSGVKALLAHAQKLGLKVMLKPHLWVQGQGWAGDLSFATVVEWDRWEKDYMSYILTYARMAALYKCEMLCIGTELRHSVKKRPQFWKELIHQVKGIYKGKLTYAANWDNYTHVPFWKDLDYIGIDAYFPLSSKKDPSPKEIKEVWKPIREDLKMYSKKNNVPILFTEYGYRSIDYTTKAPWSSVKVAPSLRNDNAQASAYQALYDCFWSEKWFAGGFLWKWYAKSMIQNRPKPTGYSPQGKKTREIIQKYYHRTQ